MTATAHATFDGTAASSGRLSSVASGVLEFVWPMYLTLVLTLGAWVLVPTVVLGWQPMTIISGSMAPSVQPGHVVVVEPYDGQDLDPGQVVTFRDADQDRLVTHRVAAIGDDGTITTRGDANAVDDHTPLTTDRIVGVGRLVVPAAGLPSLWAYEGRTDLLAVVVVLTVLAAGSAARAAAESARSVRQRVSLRGGTGRTNRRSHGRSPRARTLALATAAVVLMAVLGATGVSRAAFVGARGNDGNSFHAASIAAPTGLTVTCLPAGVLDLNRNVRVQWNAVAGATAYEVERSTALGLPLYAPRATTTQTSLDDTVLKTVLSSTSYRVRTVSGTWKSTYSTVSVICL